MPEHDVRIALFYSAIMICAVAIAFYLRRSYCLKLMRRVGISLLLIGLAYAASGCAIYWFAYIKGASDWLTSGFWAASCLVVVVAALCASLWANNKSGCCDECGYDLRGLRGVKCPECGATSVRQSK